MSASGRTLSRSHPSSVLPRRERGGLPLASQRGIFGREREIALLGTLFASGHRLVTLFGPAGMGKTCLALQFAALASTAWEAIFFCDLTASRDRNALLAAVARCLGLPANPGAPTLNLTETIARALAARGRALLVLDNVEHLLPEATDVVDAWLGGLGEAAVLATSRELLRAQEEVILELPPLPEAAELFIDRLRRLRPGHEPDPQERIIVGEIVSRLDGIPLAVELAAARARVLSLGEIRARITGSLDLLAAAPSAARSRQGTMRRAIEWSWELLDASERSALAALSVFRGGFTLDAAEAVLGPELGHGAPAPVELVQALCDKSLLVSRPGARADQPMRYGFYEIIAAFAAERLAESGRSDLVARRHARYYLDLAAALRHPARTGSPEEVLDRLTLEQTQYQAILERALAPAPLEAAVVSHALGAALVLDAISAGDGLSASEARCLDAALAAVSDEVSPTLVGEGLVVRATRASG